MKKLTTLLLALLSGAGTMFASDTSVDGIWYNFDDEYLTAEVTYQGDAYNSYPDRYSGEVVIPSSVTYNDKTYSVTSIGEFAFRNCTDLSSVTIPNSVTSIGNCACQDCSGLTSVTIGNSITSIGWRAFSGCSGLTYVTIPNSVTSIGMHAFLDCSGLTSVTIPNSVTGISNRAFSGCTGLTSITNYATTPQSINSNVFEYVDKSTCVLNVPKESVSLYQAAEGWKEFTNIVGVDVPGEDTSVDGIWYNFDDEHLTAEVTYQGDAYDTYSNEYSGEVVIPASVTYNAQTYTVTSIGDYAFSWCSGLTSVTIPNTVTSIGEWALGRCKGLTSVTIPNSVTSIGNGAFGWCSGLTSVTIPNSVTSIGGGAFGNCSGLTSLSVEAGNTVYDSRNNCNAIIKTSTNTLISGCQNTTIPESVTSIGEWAFEGCSGLTSVTIPYSVTSIRIDAFIDCTGLTSVEIPNSVTSIGNSAFEFCSGLTSVTIPNSVTSIEEYAFGSCSGLTSVTNYATTPQTINSNVFNNVDKSTCVLNVAKESVSLYQAANVWKEFTNIVGVDVPGEDPEEPIETVEGDYTINYVDKDSQALYNHVVTLYVPVAPTITGFTFLRWETVAADIKLGITIQAVYQADVPSSAPAVYTNPANPAQKLIKNGNVYILTDDKTYTITGQQVK